MSRRRKNPVPASSGVRPEFSPQTAPRDDSSAIGSLRAFSSFDATKYSERRTQVSTYPRDTSLELTGSDLRRVRNKSRYFYNNNGLATAIIDGISNLIGFLMPKPRTLDMEWNKKARELFVSMACTPSVFDRAGKYDFRSWQVQSNVCRMKDGDLLTVLTETDNKLASVIVYEAHQIDDGDDNSPTNKPTNLQDGVWKDEFGRHIGYKLVDARDGKKTSYVNANDAIFFARFRSPSQVRGFPILSSVLNHLHDRQDIWLNTKTGIKAASEVLMYEKKDAQVRMPMSTYGITEQAALGTTSGTAATAGKPVTATFDSMLLPGSLPDMAPGSTIELFHDDRPGPNQKEFLDDLVRDICINCGVDSEIVWNIIGQTGPSVRYLMAKLKRFLTQEHQRLAVVNNRFYVYFIAKAIKAGYLEPTEGWWQCDWIPQADMTIDIGREGKLALDQVRTGATTFEQIWHDAGSDADTAFASQLAFLTRAKAAAELAGFELSEVLPGFFQGMQQQPIEPPDPTDPSIPPT